MSEKLAIYIAYFTVALVIDGLKLVRYIYHSADHGKTKGQSTREWFFDKSLENLMSWTGTILVTWVCGYAFIEQVAGIADKLGSVFTWLPLSVPTAALVAWVVAYTAPNILKKFVNGKK